MNRRDFLASAAGVAALGALPRGAFAAAEFAPRPGDWRTFVVTTTLDIRKESGPVTAWVPLPSIAAADWMAPEGDQWRGNADAAEVVTDAATGARMIRAEYSAGTAAPTLTVISTFRTRDRGEVLSRTDAPPLAAPARARYLAATELLPTDGIVRETAERVTAGAATDREKAAALYDWVVENTHRVAEVRGCGLGDVASMLESGYLGGKCADINALYVALARASGVPARDVYGIRVAPSAFGYKSLGAGGETVTKAQHCRAEVWLEGAGWVPVDPADVRKVALEEPPGDNALDSAKVAAARAALFGAWEGNWMAYNDAHDLVLPGSEHRVAFLMYPQAEVAGALLDCLDAPNFAYAIKAAPITT
ncbi:transglutaminase-like domain-containing protein [Amaricoccus solimangrovi]|uniref:Transglutaminase domain-containing protein n=1 Tax=Amaricoccus solimangrovi TaxID=2589815 RepID=A0A501WGG0_9RHOB|nr:transglutaminase-like domain-containing protein [Amaricoccus solimangrovi]TPE47565.1 transglutaminase domain-containing protein [Amaricoccus solimangrovi]